MWIINEFVNNQWLLLDFLVVYLKIDDYLKILTDEEVKDFVAINFSEYFNSIREEQILIKVAKSLYTF